MTTSLPSSAHILEVCHVWNTSESQVLALKRPSLLLWFSDLDSYIGPTNAIYLHCICVQIGWVQLTMSRQCQILFERQGPYQGPVQSKYWEAGRSSVYCASREVVFMIGSWAVPLGRCLRTECSIHVPPVVLWVNVILTESPRLRNEGNFIQLALIRRITYGLGLCVSSILVLDVRIREVV